MISFANVTKSYGEVDAVSGINMHVNPGEFVMLTGPSGSGKTTLIRLLTGELKPSEGQIVVMGNDITDYKRKQLAYHRQKVAVVFQDFKLMNDQTVYENIAVTLRVQGKSSEEISERIHNLGSKIGLDRHLEVFPSQLAGGELQRTGLARAIIGEPEILLADEPTGNLDPATSWQIMHLLMTINATGTTVLVATHNTDIINSLGKRVISLQSGSIVSDGILHEQS